MYSGSKVSTLIAGPDARWRTRLIQEFVQAQEALDQKDIGWDTAGLPENVAVVPGPRTQREVCLPYPHSWLPSWLHQLLSIAPMLHTSCSLRLFIALLNACP